MNVRRTQTGYTLLELLVAVSIAALLLTGLQQVLGVGMSTMTVAEKKTSLARNARFAMARMVDSVSESNRLLIPMANIPATPFAENIRSQTVPASPPPAGSSLATAVLAVTVSSKQDLDLNGIPDADNDSDGRIDEDLPADIGNDGKPGVRDFDDDGNGIFDHFLSPIGDDDESANLSQSEDPFNGTDDDADGNTDEDPAADNNGDGCPGRCGFDDDGDSSIDEGNAADDDEDGLTDEDWLDVVVFYLQGSNLIERRAVPWDTSGDSIVSGRDYVESTLATQVTSLRFERVPPGAGRQLVDIALTITDPDGTAISLTTRVRLGGSL